MARRQPIAVVAIAATTALSTSDRLSGQSGQAGSPAQHGIAVVGRAVWMAEPEHAVLLVAATV
ncbi:MAG TPA: hypothetical protein VGV14_16315, partial [Rhodanobacter sp.]|nr:hypothetical protein [Rhodanobacter sp.]